MDASSVLMAEGEGHGVRSLLGLRNALQQICRLTLDAMHARAINKLTSERALHWLLHSCIPALCALCTASL